MHLVLEFHVNLKVKLPYCTMQTLASILTQMEWFNLQKL
jgi:hypothetical protein